MSCESFAIKHVLLLPLAVLLVLCVAILLVAPGHLPYSEWPKDLRIKHIASFLSGSCTLAGDKLQRAVDEVMRCQARSTESSAIEKRNLPQALRRFAGNFYPGCEWRKCYLPRYGHAIALVRLWGHDEPREAICFLPSDVHLTPQNASGDVMDCMLVSNGILIVLDFKKEWYGWSEPNTGGNQ